ncbi:ABC transporter substrate-binding protein [Metabacillus sediminilitoris]|uniref:ABC transporter substrate-binding protein n=1 Tax=Metabacillus sediminilitoris TaxID=2567941 RepID=A0A4S4BQI5_9BACI|nr:ABC transporter substrate-binding protein [Metabacillus sediminilitoris]QGQ45686.1 ABC transporter substrate-binding protein [Metabacillus sediminilitoris]THF77195.1 ABC transporter substrate-binding protein [Metabacillus sediminilitoris]
MVKNSHQKYALVFWMVFCSLILSLAGCAGVEKEGAVVTASDKKVTLAFPWSPQSLDPHGSDSWEIMRSGMGETLVKLNEELKPTPWLAKEWKQENETTWVFKLEDNVSFHNGKAMDAASVKESLLRSLKKDQKAKDLLQVESMEVLSENELKIVTKQPNAALIAHLADPSTIIADVTTIKDKNNDPAFTGSFKFKQFNKDESLVVERYEDYWGKEALLSEVTIKFIPDGNTRLMALQSGDVDAATDIPIDNITLLEKDEKFDVFTAPSLRTHMLLFNMSSPLFKDVALRKVIDMSIPRADIVKSIMMDQGTEAKSPFPEILPFGKVEKEKATESIEQLMKQRGWKKNADAMWEKQGKPFEVTLLTFPQRPELTVMAETIQSELLNEGIKVNIRQVENIDEVLANDDWDLSMYSMLTAHTGDPQYFLNIFYQSDSESNVSHYVSPSLDLMIGELNHTTDWTKRNQLALQIQEMINKDLPQSFIVHPKTVFGVRNGVKGFTPHPIEYYYIHSQIDVNE